MKSALKAALVLVALSASMWAIEPGPSNNKHKTAPVPEGGNAAAYVVVSGVAILGGIVLAGKKRAAKAINAKN